MQRFERGERPRRRPVEVVRETVLTVGAVLGVICVLAATASLLFGLRPLVFRSGSMEPTIRTGALGLARQVPADSVRPGDVVSVIAASGSRITHRVVTTTPGPTTELVLRGDANSRPDSEVYRVSEVDLLIAQVPGLGYVVSWLRHPIAIFLGGALVGILGVTAFRSRGSGPPDDPVPGPAPDDGEQPEPRGRRVLGVSSVAVALLVVTATSTQAAFTDPAVAATGTFATAARVPAPELRCGLLGVLSVQFTWTAVSGVTGYDLVLTPAAGAPVTFSYGPGATSATVTEVLGSGTAVIRAKIAYPSAANPSTTWYSVPSNSRSYTVAVVSLCS